MAKQHATFRIEEALMKRLRFMVHHNRGAPMFLTLDGFVGETLSKEVEKVEKKMNGGQPYDKPNKTPGR